MLKSFPLERIVQVFPALGLDDPDFRIRPLHDEDRIIVCKLRDEGLVVIEGQRVEIKNFDALSALDDFERAHLRHFRMSEALLALKRKKP